MTGLRHREPQKTFAPGRIALLLLLGLGLTPLSSAAEPGMIGAQRCAANRAAGPITYLTAFGYAATPGILDVLAAKQLGWFESLCLDVRLEPGSTNAQLVSAGTAQLAGMGDAASVLVAIDNGAEILGIATYGDVGAIELITLKSAGITALRQLSGKTIGYKVAPSPQVHAMLAAAGADPDGINFVSVGYDPAVLASGRVDALIAYKSNEPLALAARQVPIVEWDPEKFGIHATFNVLVANRRWAALHASAVEDFLRATLHAYDWLNQAEANLDRALGWAQGLSTAGFDGDVNKRRWKIETALIAAHVPPGTALGRLPDAAWQPEADMLLQAKLVSHAPVVAAAHDNRFLDAIYQGGRLLWPAP